MAEMVKERERPRSPAKLQELIVAINRVILGKDEVVRLVVTALLSRGHLLIEDIPGVGKTTLAQALARYIKCSFRRLQFTSDLLPSDILGIKVFEPATGEFKFMPGPIFHSIVLADEINRTTPRTQSALLEAMTESRVTVEGDTLPLPQPFMVIATQNPLEHHGTYPLPDSQLDRFLMSISVGYPGRKDERELLSRRDHGSAGEAPPAVMEGHEVLFWQTRVDEVRLPEEVADYLLSVVEMTRRHQKLRLGVSPRGALALRQAAKAWALLDGRDYCLPDDVKALTVPVCAHRLIVAGHALEEERRRAAREALEDILETIPVPV